MGIIADTDSIGCVADHGETQQRIDQDSKLRCLASLSWTSGAATHTDELLLDEFDTRYDLLPPAIQQQLAGKQPGQRLGCNINGDGLIPPWQDALLHTVSADDFDRHFRRGITIEPRLGRFYPRGMFSGIEGNERSSMLPCRLVGIDDNTLTIDFNHPLASHHCDLTVDIMQAWPGTETRDHQRRKLVELCTANGPGMQARWRRQPTDFFDAEAFARVDAAEDSEFYRSPRLVQHLDANCRAQIRALYDKLLPTNGELLDLMASWDSHLPERCSAQAVTGLGMNQAELDHNPMLDQRCLHDLNRNSKLPFEDARFSGAVCTASIEYLTDPQAVLGELARVLCPGARLVITFSNRWFPTKAIELWSNTHDFEHMGVVGELLQREACFTDLHSWSLRGLPRPEDDAYAGRLSYSDPVFALWATRSQH